MSLGIWHGALPGVRPGTRYGFRADGPWEPELGLRFNADKLLLDPYAPGGQRRAASTTRRSSASTSRRRTCATAATPRRTSRRAWCVHDRLRLGRRPPPLHPLARHRDLRAARQGHDRAPRPGPRAPARHVRRAGGAGRHRLPARPRRDGRRAAARAAVRDRAEGDGARPGELLGLQHHRLLRSAPRLLVGGRPRRAGARVQGDGAAPSTPPASRSSSTSSTTTPRRAAADGPTLSLPRPRRPRLLPPGRPHAPRRDVRRHLLGRHRVRQHRRRLEPLRAAADPRLAPLLDDADARRRLPLRPDCRH